MKALVVYDSMYGNTETIAKAIGGAIAGEVNVRRAGDVSASDLQAIDLLIVGSPTQGGRPTKALQDFLKGVPGPVKVAVFDTRMPARWVSIFGYAADRVAKALQRSGGTLVAPAEAFYVEGKEGPLKEGEIQRATEWAGSIARRSA